MLDDGTMHVLTCGTPEQPASQHPNLPLQASIEKTVEPCSPMQTHVLLSKSTPLPRPNSAPRFRASPAPYTLPPKNTARQGKTRPPVGSAAPSLLRRPQPPTMPFWPMVRSTRRSADERGSHRRAFSRHPSSTPVWCFAGRGMLIAAGWLAVITILRAFLWRVSMVFGVG